MLFRSVNYLFYTKFGDDPDKQFFLVDALKRDRNLKEFITSGIIRRYNNYIKNRGISKDGKFNDALNYGDTNNGTVNMPYKGDENEKPTLLRKDNNIKNFWGN